MIYFLENMLNPVLKFQEKCTNKAEGPKADLVCDDVGHKIPPTPLYSPNGNSIIIICSHLASQTGCVAQSSHIP